MISSLRGTVLSVGTLSATIEVGGVGFTVQLTAEHALSLRIGQEAFLHTAFLVREDAMSLFGFADRERLEIFELFLGVTGVGPKSALGVLSTLSPAEIARAVSSEDDAAFRKVSGIGPKTAKLIILSLAGKVIAQESHNDASVSGPSKDRADVVIALMGLGWPERSAEDGVDRALEKARPAPKNTAELLRLALAELGGQNRAAR